MIRRSRDPAQATARADALGRIVKTSARLIAGLTNAKPTERDRLQEALEVANVQHEELLSAEEELRAQVDELARALGTVQVERERYRELFEAAPDAYFVTDAFGVIRAANARAAELLDIPVRHIRGKPFPLYAAGTTDARTLRVRIADRTSHESFELGLDLLGRRRSPVRVHLRAVRIDAGRRILLIARALDPRFADSAADLARELADTRELLERERARRKALEREARARDGFLSALSRELRVPLNVVLGWTELLRRELLDHGRRERVLATIEENARSVLTIVDELLDISRGDHTQLEVRPIDLDAVVRSAFDDAGAAARAKNVSLEHTPRGGTVVLGDAKRLKRAASVLIANAIDGTPAGGVVRVQVERAASQGSIAVHDGRPEISADDLAHAFDGYQSALFAVRQIAFLHGGSVDVSSEGAGRGATFRIEIPLVDNEPLPVAASSAITTAPDLPGIRVLIVDDDHDTRELMGTLLSDAGAHVAHAAEVSDAIRVITTWRPDVILSDLGLRSHDDGLDVARGARRHLGDDVVIVAVTGFTSERDVQQSTEAGFDLHLGKPISAGELVVGIAQALALRRV